MKFLLTLFLFTFLMSCKMAPPTIQYYEPPAKTSILASKDDRDKKDDRVTRDDDRDRYLPTRDDDRDDDRGKRDYRSTRDREKECGEDCEDLCDNIFNDRRDKEECEELSFEQVDDMEFAFRILERPREDDLDEVDPEFVEDIIRISLEPITDEIEDYNSRETKDFLLWLIEEEEIMELLSEEDDESEILKELLKNLDYDSDPVKALGDPEFNDDESLMEYLVDNGDGEVFKWIHNYFKEECDDEDEKQNDCIFQQYCNILDGSGTTDERLSKSAREGLGDFDEFGDLIRDLIDQLVNNEDTWLNSGNGSCVSQNKNADDYYEICKCSRYNKTHIDYSRNRWDK